MGPDSQPGSRIASCEPQSPAYRVFSPRLGPSTRFEIRRPRIYVGTLDKLLREADWANTTSRNGHLHTSAFPKLRDWLMAVLDGGPIAYVRLDKSAARRLSSPMVGIGRNGRQSGMGTTHTSIAFAATFALGPLIG